MFFSNILKIVVLFAGVFALWSNPEMVIPHVIPIITCFVLYVQTSEQRGANEKLVKKIVTEMNATRQKQTEADERQIDVLSEMMSKLDTGVKDKTHLQIEAIQKQTAEIQATYAELIKKIDTATKDNSRWQSEGIEKQAAIFTETVQHFNIGIEGHSHKQAEMINNGIKLLNTNLNEKLDGIGKVIGTNLNTKLDGVDKALGLLNFEIQSIRGSIERRNSSSSGSSVSSESGATYTGDLYRNWCEFKHLFDVKKKSCDYTLSETYHKIAEELKEIGDIKVTPYTVQKFYKGKKDLKVKEAQLFNLWVKSENRNSSEDSSETSCETKK